MQKPPTIPATEFSRRRKAVLRSLKKSVGIVFAGDQADPLHDDFRPHPHFEYLTGIIDEPGAALVLDPCHLVAARRETLYLRPLNPEIEQWDGLRLGVGSELRGRVGMTTIYRTTSMPRYLSDTARRAKSFTCLHPLANYDQPISPDLAMFRRFEERIPGVEIVDRTDIIVGLRAIKSASEVSMIQHAVDISREGYLAVLDSIKPGMTEFDVQETLEHAYRSNGSRGPAYGTIAGAGINSTVLHYRANDQPLEDGDLVCIDSGAEFGGYGADITRTVPVSGTFTKRQREIYSIVLKAEEMAIKAVKPGVSIADIDKVARAIIQKAGYGDAFFHGIGHHLGLETHDVTPPGPLKEGNVITIEPGIYLPDEKIGVRIEDDVVVTKTGCRVLSAKIPKRAAEIEKLMGGR